MDTWTSTVLQTDLQHLFRFFEGALALSACFYPWPMNSPLLAWPLVTVVFQLVEGAGVVAALLNDTSLHFLELLLLEGQLSYLTMQGTTHCQGRRR